MPLRSQKENPYILEYNSLIPVIKIKKKGTDEKFDTYC